VVLIYNSLDDKDYEEVLRILKPKIKRVEIIEIDSQRATTLEEIAKALDKLEISYSNFKNIDEDEKYILQNSSETMALASSNGDAKASLPSFARTLILNLTDKKYYNYSIDKPKYNNETPLSVQRFQLHIIFSDNFLIFFTSDFKLFKPCIYLLLYCSYGFGEFHNEAVIAFV